MPRERGGQTKGWRLRYNRGASRLGPGADALVLCSHLLFLYTADLTLETHVLSIREMLRVGCEVRLFPLLDLDGRESRHLWPALEALRGEAEAELVQVAFEFQRGARRMLRIRGREPARGG